MRALLLTTLVILLAGCGERGVACPCLQRLPDAPTPTTLPAHRERATRPTRIVSLAPGLTEIVAHLDGTQHLVGVTPWCNHPAAVEGIQQVTVLPLDFEGIVALRPDLLLADRTLHRSAMEQLRQRFPDALLELESSRSLADLEASMSLVAAELTTAAAADKAQAWARRLAAVAAPSEGSGDRPLRVLVVSEWEPLNVIGPFGLMHDMLRLAGCVNVACDTNMPSGPFSAELVLERRPDVILHRSGTLPKRLRTRWRAVPAVANDRIASCESDDLARGGPRILDGLARLRAVLHDEAAMQTLAGTK